MHLCKNLSADLRIYAVISTEERDLLGCCRSYRDETFNPLLV